MKRSEINHLVHSADSCFRRHGWALPPKPRWDVTDFGLAQWRKYGLILVNLAEEPEYCEKLMYALKNIHYRGFAATQIPHPHEYFVPMDALTAEHGHESPAIRELVARASVTATFLAD